jgi:MYXO-CTERM domain-containing protein
LPSDARDGQPDQTEDSALTSDVTPLYPSSTSTFDADSTDDVLTPAYAEPDAALADAQLSGDAAGLSDSSASVDGAATPVDSAKSQVVADARVDQRRAGWDASLPTTAKDDGCSCRLGSRGTSARASSLLVMAGLLVAFFRRRRKGR